MEFFAIFPVDVLIFSFTTCSQLTNVYKVEVVISSGEVDLRSWRRPCLHLMQVDRG